MEQDINFLVSRLGKIEGFGDTGDTLLSIVKAKKVEDPPTEEPAEGEKTSNGDGAGEKDNEEAKKADSGESNGTPPDSK